MAARGLPHSRSSLLSLSLILSIAILISFHFDVPLPTHDDDVDYALEAMNYLHDAQRGHASISPVVEDAMEVREWRWWCSPPPPLRVSPPLQWTSTHSFHLFSSYLDTRPNSLFPHHSSVQVLAMSRRLPPRVFCTLFPSLPSSPIVVEGRVREIWQRGWDPRGDFVVPLLVSCPLPLSCPVPLSVQLSTVPCEGAEEALAVTSLEGEDRSGRVAVCVKGMDFQEDISSELVEWIESQLLFGADSISIYVYSVPPPVRRVLEYYEKEGKLQMIPISLPPPSPQSQLPRSLYIKRNRQQKRRYELLPYNDCFYRHLSTHSYVLVVDTDEVVVPLRHDNWTELLREVEANNPQRKLSSISLRNVFKFPRNESDSSEERRRLLPYSSNRIRSLSTSKRGDYGKSFSRISNVASLFNHFALHRLSPSVSPTVHLPPSVAVKLHYKGVCPVESRSECRQLREETTRDEAMDRFIPTLEHNVRRAHQAIGL